MWGKQSHRPTSLSDDEKKKPERDWTNECVQMLKEPHTQRDVDTIVACSRFMTKYSTHGQLAEWLADKDALTQFELMYNDIYNGKFRDMDHLIEWIRRHPTVGQIVDVPANRYALRLVVSVSINNRDVSSICEVVNELCRNPCHFGPPDELLNRVWRRPRLALTLVMNGAPLHTCLHQQLCVYDDPYLIVTCVSIMTQVNDTSLWNSMWEGECLQNIIRRRIQKGGLASISLFHWKRCHLLDAERIACVRLWTGIPDAVVGLVRSFLIVYEPALEMNTNVI